MIIAGSSLPESRADIERIEELASSVKSSNGLVMVIDIDVEGSGDDPLKQEFAQRLVQYLDVLIVAERPVGEYLSFLEGETPIVVELPVVVDLVSIFERTLGRQMLRLIGGNMKRVLLITMILIGTFALSQIHLENSLAFGGEGDDVANDLVVLSDGKLLLVGYTTSFSGELGSSKGEEDFLILKLDERLRIIWSKTYGGSGRDIAEAVLETSDGEIVVGD